MSQKLRFGFYGSWIAWPAMVRLWRRMEALGCDSMWLDDSSPYGRTNPDGTPLYATWYETWTLLAGLAAQTSRMRIGTLVTSIVFRNPAFLAKQALTVDHISNGRLELGIGAGEELQNASAGLEPWSPAERVGRLREAVEILDSMLRNEVTSYQGRYYQVQDAVRGAPPVQQPRPPLTIAAHGPVSLKIAAAYADTWNATGGASAGMRAGREAKRQSLDEAIEVVRRQSLLLDEYCAVIGRDPRTITRSFCPALSIDELWTEAEGGGMVTRFASKDAFQELVGRLQEVGISEFIFAVPDEMLERVVTDWIASLRGAP